MRNLNRSLVLSYYWENGRKAAGGIATGLAMLALLFWMGVTLPLHQERDVSGTATRQGIGVVTGITDPAETRASRPVRASILSIRLGGRDVVCRSPVMVFVGEPLRVYYRVGRSGVVYVSHVEPTHS